MKKYKAYFSRAKKPKMIIEKNKQDVAFNFINRGLYWKKVDEEIEATTFADARNRLRDKYENSDYFIKGIRIEEII